jgi:hypothetical protein
VVDDVILKTSPVGDEGKKSGGRRKEEDLWMFWARHRETIQTGTARMAGLQPGCSIYSGRRIRRLSLPPDQAKAMVRTERTYRLDLSATSVGFPCSSDISYPYTPNIDPETSHNHLLHLFLSRYGCLNQQTESLSSRTTMPHDMASSEAAVVRGAAIRGLEDIKANCRRLR